MHRKGVSCKFLQMPSGFCITTTVTALAILSLQHVFMEVKGSLQARITVIMVFLLAANSSVRKNRMGVGGTVWVRNEAEGKEGNLLRGRKKKKILLNKHWLEFEIEVYQLWNVSFLLHHITNFTTRHQNGTVTLKLETVAAARPTRYAFVEELLQTIPLTQNKTNIQSHKGEHMGFASARVCTVQKIETLVSKLGS